MSSVGKKKTVKFICPYCKITFKKDVETQKRDGLSTILIKSHLDGDNCPLFLVFVDNNGRHRGSQKIDNFEDDASINDQIVEDARIRIEEIKEALRFYHLKAPRKEGRGFEHKVASVLDRAIISSKSYSQLISFLGENEEENIFGAITIPKDTEFEGGLLIYGKYHGMIYSLFWRDQKSILSKTYEDLKVFANLTIEKLLDLYDITSYFF